MTLAQNIDHTVVPEMFAHAKRRWTEYQYERAFLLDRITFFVEEPRADYLREFIGDLRGTSGRQWQADDFALRPPRKRSRDDWGGAVGCRD